jgi:hypothetical protein
MDLCSSETIRIIRKQINEMKPISIAENRDCMRQSRELQIGKAGEYLVCADLILKGFVAFPSEQGLPYDVVLDNGKKLLKIQVKTTERLRIVPQRNKESKCYIFNIKRHGKNNKRKYELNEIDIFALVCLNNRRVGYLLNAEMPNTINLRCDDLRGSYYDEVGIVNHKKVVGLKDKMYCSEISRELGLHVSTVNRMLKPGYEPFKTNSRYFSDLIRSSEWISKL